MSARRVAVANPGGQSHFKHIAAAFADDGSLDSYFSTVGFDQAAIDRITGRLPHRIAQPLGRELRRRSVEPAVAAKGQHVASAWELANVLLSRAQLPASVSSAGLRPTRKSFDRGVARRLTPGLDAVVGYQGAATATFRRARTLGAATVLDYPIAHFGFTERLLSEEAELVPEYASTLRVRTYPEWLRRRYEDEIATADRIIMVSREHQRNFERAGIDPARTFIVPWYVDHELFTPAADREDGVFRVLFLGQLSQRKGLSYLIDGFVRAGLDDAELVLIGSTVGTTRPWANKPHVRHIPPVPNYELPALLQTANVISLPSLVEGFPVAVLEGMACGLPAIISENLGHDVVEDSVDGFVVPIRDPDAIAERLRLLHADSARRRQMSIAARAKAEQFTIERYRSNLRAGVHSLIDRR